MQVISKSAHLLSMTSQQTVANVMGSWLEESYVSDRVDSVIKGMVSANKRQTDLIERTEQSQTN